jgi:putative endonuclease
MHFVYAIQSERDRRIYVGMCADIEVRLKEHNAGKTRSTKGFVPWKLIYKEGVSTRLEARKREIYLKSGIGKEFLKSLVP